MNVYLAWNEHFSRAPFTYNFPMMTDRKRCPFTTLDHLQLQVQVKEDDDVSELEMYSRGPWSGACMPRPVAIDARIGRGEKYAF